MRRRRTATYQELSERFFIDRSSPTFLRSKKSGKPAGTLRPGGDSRVSWKANGENRHMMLSHVIWILHHKKEIPLGHVIDHRDGDTINCNPNNLKSKTHRKNMLNLGSRANNTSGFPGVQKHKTGKWMARSFPIDGKRKVIGFFDTPEEADRARRKWIVDNGYELPTNRSRKHFLTITDRRSLEEAIELLRKSDFPVRVVVMTQTKERTDEP